MKIKKTLSELFVCVLAIMLIVSGCSPISQSGNNQAPTQKPAVSGDDTPQKSKEPVELTLFSAWGTQNFEEEWYYNNPLADKILEISGVKIKYNFPTVTAGDAHDKLNLLLASDSYDDIIWMAKDDILDRVIKEKIAIPMDDLIEKVGPNVKDSYGSVLDMIRWDDGKIYYLTSGYGEINPEALPGPSGYTFNFRYDLYQKLGSPKLETVDDVYNFLVALRENFPKNSEGVDAYPLGGFVQGWQNMLDTLINSAGGYYSRYYIDDNGELSYWVRAPWALDVIKFYNKVYREGLIDPEAFVMDRGTWQKEKLGTEKVYSYFGNGGYGRAVEATYQAKGLTDAIMESYPVRFPNGQTPRIVEESSVGGKQLIITDKCKDPEAAMRWIDTLCLLNFEVCNGIEGGIWSFVDGKPTLHEDVLQKYLEGPVTDQTWAPDTGFALYRFVARTVGGSEWGTNMILKDDPYVLGNERVIRRQERLIGFNYDTYPFTVLLRGASDELVQKHTIIDERMKNEIYQAVFAETEEKCVQEFNKYISEIEGLGLKELEAHWNANYKKVTGK